MKLKRTFLLFSIFCTFTAFGQIGKRFPSEKKIVKDPVTGYEITFLTSKPNGDSKIYPTHPQWTSDGNWVLFRSHRVEGEIMAVNEKSGDIVQVTEGGYSGTFCIAQKSMKVYFMRDAGEKAMQIIEVDLDKVFKDSKSGKRQAVSVYERICGKAPAQMEASGDMALDANEDKVYFRVGKNEALKYLDKNTILEKNFGPRNMGAGPGGISSMNLKTGEFKHVISVGFQIGHIQSNTWNPNEIIFCWETGGKSPQRTWTVMGDGSGLRPLYSEASYEWVTHEAVIGKDEVAMAIMGHRKIDIQKETSAEVTDSKEVKNPENPGQESNWGATGTREKPTGLAIVNLRTREMIIAGQTKSGSGFWHVHGSSDGRWATGDDFSRSLYLIDRKTSEVIMLTTGHKETAKDHIHPTFNREGTKIQFESAMLSEDNKTMNICIINVPESWLNRKYKN
jgi:oligogalacturonide lyase